MEWLTGPFVGGVPPTKAKQSVEINISNNIALNKDMLADKLSNPNALSSAEYFEVLKYWCDQLIDGFIKGNRTFVNLFANREFVTALKLFVNQDGFIYPVNFRLVCNKATYDFIANTKKPKNNPDMQRYIAEVKDLLCDVCLCINGKMVTSLTSTGLSIGQALYVSIARLSSSNEEESVVRLNYYLCNQGTKSVSEAKLVKIYECLFDRISPLFYGTMFDVFTGPDELYYAEFGETFSTITLAVLDILEQMPMVDIETVLRKYAARFKEMGNPEVRTSLYALSSDYSRIVTCVESLRREYVYVP